MVPSRIGSLLFALALAFLSVAAGREILRPTRAALVVAVALAIPVAAFSAWSPRWGAASALVAAAWLVLAHAMLGAVRRLAPVTRVRVFFVVTLILGAAGAMGAVLDATR